MNTTDKPTALLTFRVPRSIDAPPVEVFGAWAKPELFRQWFEPRRAILQPAAGRSWC